jgi:hypothetical protein
MNKYIKRIGKIKSVSFGNGGYQDAMFGVSFELGGDGWGVGDFKGAWGPGIDSKNCKWTETDRSNEYAQTMRFIASTMTKARVNEIHELVNIPIEVKLDGNMLKSWRILEEVL